MGWCKYFSQEMRQQFGGSQATGAGMASPTFDIDFMNSSLGAGAVFTRASTGWAYGPTGVLTSYAGNVPRFDYDPATLALKGLLLEDTSTNLVLNSGNASNASWGSGNAQAPVTTPNQVAAPDGTLTATRAVYPVATGAGAWWNLVPIITGGGAAYAYSVWLRGLTGGERLYLNITQDGITYYRTQAVLTTAWQRFSVITPTLGSTTTYFQLGTDLRDASQTATPAQTVFVWGGQVEAGAFPTSYIPTTAATVTRAQDNCLIPSANMSWFISPGGSWFVEFIAGCPPLSGRTPRLISNPSTASSATPLYFGTSGQIGQYDVGGAIESGANLGALGSINKAVSTWAPGAARACVNAGAIGIAAMPTGYALLSGTGIGILSGVPAETMTGCARRLQYWPRVLSDAEVLQVTT
jgi:hypothetical protein